MPTYRLQIEYDGGGYHGWQVQPELPTVQGAIERALMLLTRQTVRTSGAGRTDRGVHARGQVASFRIDTLLDCRRVIAGIQGICGHDIKVRRMEEAPERFHARHDALWREYAYRLLEHPSALERDRAWRPPCVPTIARLREASVPLVGHHDFSAFANASADEVDPRCTILSAEWDCWEGGLLLRIRADHFLYKMVRTIVATLVRESITGGRGAEGIGEILASGSRSRARPPAPAAGLCLERVGYDPPWPSGG